MANPLHDLVRLGQSVWLDQLSRDWLPEVLAAYVERDAVSGVTTNPAIFQQALAGSKAYDAPLRGLARKIQDPAALLDVLLLDDIRQACDVLRGVFERTDGLDGYVSHEVSPLVAHDEAATVAEACRLWQAIDRPNALIKIPATRAGIQAGRECLRQGVKVNMTLVFSLRHYEAVIDAYTGALEDRVAAGQPVGDVASVASVFVSRVDTHVDAELDRRLAALPPSSPETARLAGLRGRAAVANGRLIWHRSREWAAGERFRRLERQGARPQRVLWASTSTKNPAYPDVKYVEELAGPMSINTIPLGTLEAFRDHGCARDMLTDSEGEALAVMAALAECRFDLLAIGDVLLEQGLDAFERAYRSNLQALAARAGLVAEGGVAT